MQKVSSSSSSSSRSNSPPADSPPADTPLDVCILKIKQIINDRKLELFQEKEGVEKFNCPITQTTINDPVATNCGHVFEKAMVEQWLSNHTTCPSCKKTGTVIATPVLSMVRDLINEERQKEPIVTCALFESQDDELAAMHREYAEKLLNAGKDKGALEIYAEALKYTRSSAVYSAIPSLYEKLGEEDNAVLARLYLGQYQLQEGKVGEAIQTLKSCELEQLKATLTSLALTSSQSPEAIGRAMDEALSFSNPEDKIFVYKQILSYAPDCLPAYENLIPLIKDFREKRDLCYRAALHAHNLGQLEAELAFRAQAEIQALPTEITRAGWANPQTVALPPYPQALVDFLAGDCTIWPRRPRSETHIVVPLFPNVVLEEGQPAVPLTLDTLDRLDKGAGGTGYRYIWGQIPKNAPANVEFRWGVMTKDVIPGSRDKLFDEQQPLLPAGYVVPKVLNAARAILWNSRCTGGRIYSDNPYTYTRCEEVVGGYRLVVGGFDASGLTVNYFYGYGSGNFGVAGWREF